MSANQETLAVMRQALDAHLAGTLPAGELIARWRASSVSLTLPPVFGQAMEELLRRMEMSAVFAQDSCSFSSSAVAEQLGKWLDKAGTV
ncbi:hypothetical protein [Cupriavidus pauculus]|uniref:hypothetical protein n=1 Tax=Cupriavidus pauculus TaxID=82633 RepID=UPI001EE2FF6D|nr:hypothetical protein [Cupriavidus pauculus]GJG92964.1 hypothetical protein CBA19C6_00765 [Cupriavidus pauculus]